MTSVVKSRHLDDWATKSIYKYISKHKVSFNRLTQLDTNVLFFLEALTDINNEIEN